MSVVYDWRQAASRAGLSPLDVVLALRDTWPANDRGRQPNRTKDVDRLAADAEMAPVVEGVIADLQAKGVGA